MKPELMGRFDALVVGAGPAGAATAMLLARAGLSVLAVDRGHEGGAAPGAEPLFRAGVLQLRRWGLLEAVRAAGTPAVRSETFHYGADRVVAQVRPRDGVEALHAPHGSVLGALLVRAAREAGARVEHRVAAHALLEGPGGRVRGAVLVGPEGPAVEVEAGIVIGADGLHSRVAAHAHAPVERAGRHATAMIHGLWSGLPAEGYGWFYRPGASAGVFPASDGQACLSVSMPRSRYLAELPAGLDRLHRAVLEEAAPELAAALAGARLGGKLHAIPGAPGQLRRGHGPGWALVGAAGHHTDALSVHGLTAALRDAELLARAVAAGTVAALAGWQGLRDGISLPFLELSDRVASFAWDLDTIRPLHEALARELAAETDLVRRLDGVAPGPPLNRGEAHDRAA